MKKSTIILLAILVIALIIGIVFAVKWFVDHPKVTVVLDVNGGSLGYDTIELRYGREYSLPIPVRKDFDFYGWYLGNAKIDTMGGRWGYDREVTLVAKWKIVAENKLAYSIVDGGVAVSDFYGDNLDDIVVPAKFSGKNVVSLGGDFEILKGKLSQASIDRITFYVPTGCKVEDLSSLGVKCDIVRYDYTENEYFYINNGDSYSLSGYIGEPVDVIDVPTVVADKPVTSIVAGAFNSLVSKYSTSELTFMKVYIPDTIKVAEDELASQKPIHKVLYTLKNGDFYYYDKGTHIVIAEYAGNYKSNIVIPDTYDNKPIFEIDEYAFYGATSHLDHSSSSFVSVLLPTSIKAIGAGAFGECNGLKVSLYERKDDNTIREIIDVPYVLYEWYPLAQIGSNPGLIDVLTQLKPAFGWSTYSNANHYVKFNTDGGSVTTDGKTVEYLALKRNKAYSLPIPTKEGHTFAGWYCGETLVALEGERWIYSTHVELTAKWTEN